MTFSKLAALGLVGLVASPALAEDTKAAPAASSELKDLRQKASYGIGVSIARDFKAKGLDLDVEALSKGLKDAFGGGKCLLTDEQLEEALQAFQKDFVAKAGERRKTMAAENKKKGDAFLAANKQKAGVKTLPSGLQYKVLKEGTGKTPKATDTVTTNYKGTFLDGSEFDSSFKGNKPVSFQVNRVIKGWTEALQLMKVGSKWELYVPSELAYREEGNQGIPPNSTLIFEVELLGIE